MMRSSNSRIQGGVDAVNSETPLENGLSSKEGEDETCQNVRELAAKVVEDVVQKAAEAAQERSSPHRRSSSTRNRGCGLQRLPTIQIDTVPSPPPSPLDWTPPDESDEVEEPVLDESEIQLDLEAGQEELDEDLREFLKSYVEDIVSQAMVVAEKKIQFVGLPDDDDEEDEEPPEPSQSPLSSTKEPDPEPEIDDSEIRAAAEKVVEDVISKATETVAQRLENGFAGMRFPILFDDAPEEVQEAASAFVKEIIGRAVASAEEKFVPTVPFNFEDVDLMKSSGPWYVRAREAFIRLLRTACFCTPRRTDS